MSLLACVLLRSHFLTPSNSIFIMQKNILIIFFTFPIVLVLFVYYYFYFILSAISRVLVLIATRTSHITHCIRFVEEWVGDMYSFALLFFNISIQINFAFFFARSHGNIYLLFWTSSFFAHTPSFKPNKKNWKLTMCTQAHSHNERTHILN